MLKQMARYALAAGATITALTPALASHSWGGYHWARTSNPFTLEVDSALTGTWPGYVTTALSDWNTPTGNAVPLLHLVRPSVDPAVSAKRCSAISGKILVCNDHYGQRGWLGIASISLNGAHITSGTTKLNDSYFDLQQYSSASWHRMVACQEIGHDFGLDHQDTAYVAPNLGTCMDYTNDPSGAGAYKLNNEHPNQHDYDELVTIYSHTDSTSTIAQANSGVLQVGEALQHSASFDPGDSPAQWGRPIRSDAQGRPNVYARSLGDGQVVLTHVLWAIGEGPGRSQ